MELTLIIVLIVVAEAIRRCIQTLLGAFTGPLSKVPGPFLWKITKYPWMIENITGNATNVLPGLFKKYGDVVRVTPTEVIFASGAACQKILVEEDYIKSPLYDTLKPRGGISNLISERDKTVYKQKRRLLSPGFSINYLNGLEPLMKDCLNIFEEYLDNECSKGQGYAVVDIENLLGRLTFDVMSATSFGGSFSLVSKNDKKVKNMFSDYLKRAALHSAFPYLRYVPFAPPAEDPEMHKFIERTVAKRREEKIGRKDLLQIFIDTNKEYPDTFTDRHIHEEMILFMIAGSDTTSLTATFTLLLLLNNPEKLQKLVAEIDGLSGEITFQTTQDLQYLGAVINESMRIMPIVQVGLARYVKETAIIDNYEIPPNTIVSASLGVAMKNSSWPDAEKFIPERWLDNRVDRKSFMPFSGGSRNCIGQQFALKELRLILVKMLRRYELSLIPGQSHELRVHTVPWFVQGFYNVGVKLRKV